MFVATLARRIEQVFFAPISSQGFGLMRMGWAIMTLLIMVQQWINLSRYFADPPNRDQFIFFHPYRWSLLDWATDPAAVWALYCVLLVSCLCVLLGIFPRLSLLVSLVLLLSFQEKNFMPFHSNIAVLRLVGILLLISPVIDSYSLKRFAAGRSQTDSMPAWPYRLLLWQTIVVYTTASWFKLLNPVWTDGTAFQKSMVGGWSVLPVEWGPFFEPFSTVMSYSSIVWEMSWVLLLIPLPFIRVWLRRFLLITGIPFHLLIGLTMPLILSLSLAIFVMYLGLLTADDIALLKRYLAKGKKIVALVP